MLDMRDDVNVSQAKRLADAGGDRQDGTVEATLSIALQVCAEIFEEKLQEINALLEELRYQSRSQSDPSHGQATPQFW